MYDAQIGRWTATDPYDEFAGPYIGMGSNPVNFIDPDGGSIFKVFESVFLNHVFDATVGALTGAIISGVNNGWRWDAMLRGMGNGALVGLGASITEWNSIESILAGAKGIFDTHKIITFKAKFFSDRVDGYNYMWDNSFDLESEKTYEHYKENGSLFVDGGLLVLPNYRNDAATTKIKEVVEIKEDKNGRWTHVKHNSKWLKIKGFIHTHPHASAHPDDGGLRLPSDEDEKTARVRFPGLPNFVMSKKETYSYTGYKGGVKKVGFTIQVLSGRIKLVNFK